RGRHGAGGRLTHQPSNLILSRSSKEAAPLRNLVLVIPVILFALSCGPAAIPAQKPQQEADLAKSQEQKQAIQCDAGQEHWHATTQPKRGGTLKAATSARSMLHMDPTQPGVST